MPILSKIAAVMIVSFFLAAGTLTPPTVPDGSRSPIHLYECNYINGPSSFTV